MLTESQIERYARHVLLPEVGGTGQSRLLTSHVRVRWLDAAGAWTAAYLALAGVGRIDLDDPRPVTDPLPLLARSDLGRRRDAAIAAALRVWSPDVEAQVGGQGAEFPVELTVDWHGAGDGAVLWGSLRADELSLAWCDACDACRREAALVQGPASPATAALAGSLAAGEVILRLLGRTVPRVQRMSLTGPLPTAACSHGVTYPAPVLRAIAAHAVASYPAESCGFVLGPDLAYRPATNVADRYHAADPASFPRTSRTSYVVDPREQLEVMELERRGGSRVVAIVHSHCDGGARFSGKDREDAAGGTPGRPLFPGVEYVVVAVGSRGGSPHVEAMRAYAHEETVDPGIDQPNERWNGRPLPLPSL